jgi:hypothetical protein
MSISQTECHTECQSRLLGVTDPQTYTALQAEIKIQKNQKEPRKNTSRHQNMTAKRTTRTSITIHHQKSGGQLQQN